MSYVHHLRIRYGECDMQRVVFNANYFAYCDDAVDTWFRTVLAPGGGGFESAGFDFMLKKAEIVWHAPLVFGETAALRCSIARWGTTSFDVHVDGRGLRSDAAADGEAPGEPRFEATITYVSVVPGEHRPVAVPQAVRAALGEVPASADA